jgi:hypothetical protein
VKLVLSTAQPHGGLLPTLGTTYAEFYRPPPPKPAYKPQRIMACRTMAMNGGGAATTGGTNADDSDEDMGCGLFDSAPATGGAMKVNTMEASEQILSSTFTIPQAKTIPTDDSEHKVSIRYPSILKNMGASYMPY